MPSRNDKENSMESILNPVTAETEPSVTDPVPPRKEGEGDRAGLSVHLAMRLSFASFESLIPPWLPRPPLT